MHLPSVKDLAMFRNWMERTILWRSAGELEVALWKGLAVKSCWRVKLELRVLLPEASGDGFVSADPSRDR